MFNQCQEELNLIMAPPLTESQLLTFIGWLLQRDLSSATINSYLSSLRQLYLKLGLNPSSIRSELVGQVIRGRSNQELVTHTSGSSKVRLPITPAVLQLIKQDLSSSTMPPVQKLLLWSVCTISFAGAFRVSEILAVNSSRFDPLKTLLGKDLQLMEIQMGECMVPVLQITLKQEKTNKSKTPTVIDIFEADGPLCPINAYRKWRLSSPPLEDDLPAFRTASGRALTNRDLNLYLADFTSKYFPSAEGKFTSHSFRIGLASTLGKLGLPDSDIKAAGRWSSRCFETYLRLPRTKRAAVAKMIGSIST